MAANGGSRKRKVQLRLDDGSLIGSVETLLGNGGSGTVLLDFEAACRTGRASKSELERLDKLISSFQTRVNGFHALPRGELKARNPYTQDVSGRRRPAATEACTACSGYFSSSSCNDFFGCRMPSNSCW
jgi:hypothetical protein